MIPTDADKQIIARWLTRLAGVCRTPVDDPLDRDKLTDYTELLAMDLPPAAFTMRSLHAAAEGREWFPPYAAIAETVARWWSENRPKAAPMISDGRESLEGMDLHWQNFWAKRSMEISTLDDRRKAENERANLESLIRKQLPKAYERIAGKPAQERCEPLNQAQRDEVLTRFKAAKSGITVVNGDRAA